MTTPKLKLGFIGLGIMGTPMAQHLLNAGHQLFTYTRSKTPASLTEAGAALCASATDVAKLQDLIAKRNDAEAVMFEHLKRLGYVA